ncbi:MAG: hypothetical protein ACK5U7_16315 [Bacteroidota bacterium]|jgi:hypothetical protein
MSQLSFHQALDRIRTEPRIAAVAIYLITQIPNVDATARQLIIQGFHAKMAERTSEALDAINHHHTLLRRQLSTLDSVLTGVNSDLADEKRRHKALSLFVADLAKEGLRCDLNPTLNCSDTQVLYASFANYLTDQDTRLRARAQAALDAN